MGNIILLDDLTINKIAAGEVIERPASAVKELVENSIDAGATNITVEIKNGGISYIRVTDNGKGIMPDDLEIAFERHATSKIRVAGDIETVRTMGFRGEALASIAAIAKVTMKSKTMQHSEGNQIVVEGGKIISEEEIGCPNGTSIIIENLFYNTPVRYKFLKKDFTEAGYIEDTITRIALIHPEIAIKLVNTGRTIISTSGNGDIKGVIYGIYGKDIAENLLNVDYEYENIKITGVVGKPEIARSNRANQLFFVNKRYIKNRTLTAANEQAFKNLIPVGKYGFLILNIEIDPRKVDVNVHPAKLEVRFQQEQDVFRAVYNAIKETLQKNNFNKMNEYSTENFLQDDETKKIEHTEEKPSKNELKVEENEEKKGFFKKLLSRKEKEEEPTIVEQVYEKRRQENSNIEEQAMGFNAIIEKITEMQESVKDFKEDTYEDKTEPSKEFKIEEKQPEEKAEFEIEEKQPEIKEELKIEEKQPEVKEEFEIEEKEPEVKEEFETEEKETEIKVEENEKLEETEKQENAEAQHETEEEFEEMYTSIFGIAPKSSHETEVNEQPETYLIPDTEEILTSENLSLFEQAKETNIPKYKFIGIAFDSYIVIELDKELYILDQKAANEKIIYEELKRNYNKQGERDSQLMLLPDIINLTPKQMLIVEDNIDMFEKAGFTLETFGQNTIKLTGVPSICLDLETKEIFLAILEQINKVARTDREAVEEKFISTLATKISENSKLAYEKEEVDSLMKKLLVLPNAFTSPTNKQVAVKMTKADIERKFSRR